MIFTSKTASALRAILASEGLLVKKTASMMSESDFWKVIELWGDKPLSARRNITEAKKERLKPDWKNFTDWVDSFIEAWGHHSKVLQRALLSVKRQHPSTAYAMMAGHSYYQQVLSQPELSPKVNYEGRFSLIPGGLPLPKLPARYPRTPLDILGLDEDWSFHPTPGFVEQGAPAMVGDPTDLVARVVVYGGGSLDYDRAEISEMLDQWRMYTSADNLPKWLWVAGAMDHVPGFPKDWHKVRRYIEALATYQGPTLTINLRSDDRSKNSLPTLA